MIDHSITLDMTDSELLAAAHMMKLKGGRFAGAIADAYFAASPRNRQRLLAAFGDLFREFRATPGA